MKRALSTVAVLAVSAAATTGGLLVRSDHAVAAPSPAPAASPTDPGPTQTQLPDPTPTDPGPTQTTIPDPRPTQAPTQAPGPDPALARFYEQKLDWTKCGDDQCAQLTVPVDYAHPEGATTTLALLKSAATGQRRSSLVVNPGGPGVSGVNFAKRARSYFGKQVTGVYDVVGLDPRGVARSHGIQCQNGKDMDAFLGVDPTPDTPQEQQALVERVRAFGAACAKNSPQLVGHMSSADTARDLDILRAALGEKKLHYFGASYGTFLGATYADLFPKNVGRMVLDGATDPRLTSEQRSAGQAQGFERAFDAFAASCAKRPDCPLGKTTTEIQQKVHTLLASLDAKPLDTHGVGPAGGLTQAWAWNGIAATLYDKASWASLESGLKLALKGNGVALMMVGVQSVGRGDDGSYSDQMQQAINAVNCLDRGDTGAVADYGRRQQQFAAKWPTLGANMAWAGMVCGTWPVKATDTPHEVTAKGSAPIVVVGTTGDPATPYEQAVSLAKGLENGRLITREGDGHTGYHRGSSCVDTAVDGFLVDGKDPGKDLRCATDPAAPSPSLRALR